MSEGEALGYGGRSSIRAARTPPTPRRPREVSLWLEARTSQGSAVMNPHVFRAPGPEGQGSHATLSSQGENRQRRAPVVRGDPGTLSPPTPNVLKPSLPGHYLGRATGSLQNRPRGQKAPLRLRKHTGQRSSQVLSQRNGDQPRTSGSDSQRCI